MFRQIKVSTKQSSIFSWHSINILYATKSVTSVTERYTQYSVVGHKM